MGITIPILIDTIDAFHRDENGLEYFEFLESLVDRGYIIELFRKGDDEVLQTFNSLEHIKNFIKGHRRALGI